MKVQGVFFKTDLSSQMDGDIQHGAHIEDIGHIGEGTGFIGQHESGDHGENGVFVAPHSDGAPQRLFTFDDK